MNCENNGTKKPKKTITYYKYNDMMIIIMIILCMLVITGYVTGSGSNINVLRPTCRAKTFETVSNTLLVVLRLIGLEIESISIQNNIHVREYRSFGLLNGRAKFCLDEVNHIFGGHWDCHNTTSIISFIPNTWGGGLISSRFATPALITYIS